MHGLWHANFQSKNAKGEVPIKMVIAYILRNILPSCMTKIFCVFEMQNYKYYPKSNYNASSIIYFES